MKISVIIPVYNVEKTLAQCLKSVMDQSYKNLEIILVDDGSTDESGRMCDLYRERDFRIQVIHQENKGLGEARNTGIKYAEGEYIAFVDSDDYLDTDAYRQLADYIKVQACDICFFGHYRVVHRKTVPYDAPPLKTEYYGKKEILGSLMNETLHGNPREGNSFTGVSVCCGLYKKELLVQNQIRFQSERKILSEDILFNIEACICAETVRVYPKHLYYYVRRCDSLTTVYREDRFSAALCLDNEIKEMTQRYGVYDLICDGIDYTFGMNLIVCMKQEICFECLNGHKALMENLKNYSSQRSVISYIERHENEFGFKKKLILGALKRRWLWMVYVMLRLEYIYEGGKKGER